MFDFPSEVSKFKWSMNAFGYVIDYRQTLIFIRQIIEENFFLCNEFSTNTFIDKAFQWCNKGFALPVLLYKKVSFKSAFIDDDGGNCQAIKKTIH